MTVLEAVFHFQTSNDILVVGNDGVIGLIIGTLKAIRGMRTFLRTGYQKVRTELFPPN